MKQGFIFLFIVLLLFLGCSENIVHQNLDDNSTENFQIREDNFLPTYDNLYSIVKTNNDSLDYLNSNPGAKIISVEKFLTSDKLNNTDFPNEYSSLDEKEYYEVRIKGKKDLTLVAIIDFDKREVVRAFGIFIMGVSTTN